MAKYKYYCPECEKEEEVLGSHDHDVPECDDCECKMERDFTAEGPPGISFKGEGNNTGFHSVDYE